MSPHSFRMQLPMGYFFLFMVMMPAVLAVAHSHGTVTSEVYWQLMLPNTPMPAVIRDHLSSVTGVVTHEPSKDLAGTAGNRADAIVTGPEGNPVTIYRDVKRPLLFYPKYRKEEDPIETSRSKADATVTGPEGNPVTIYRDVKRPLLFYPKYGKEEDPIETSRSKADATVTGPEGNPVTIYRDVKRPLLYYPKYGKEENPIETSRSKADATVTGPEGNPVTIYRDVKRPILFYPKYGKEKDPIETSRSKADATVTGPEGNPVTIYRDVKRPLLFYPKYEKEEDPIETSRKGTDPMGRLVTINHVYHGNEEDHIHSDLTNDIHPKPNPVTTANIGVNSKQHASDDNRIDNPSTLFFFLERDMHVGAKIGGMFARPLDGDHFLSPVVADSMPFSSRTLPHILNRFSIQPNSFVAKKMEQVHYFCELPPAKGEKKHCATSLESMVDFITSSLNSSASNMAINALSSTSEKDTTTSTHIYTMASIRSVPMQGSPSVACHLEVYPYTVYHCHMTHGTKLYAIKLADQSAANTVEAVASCHRDTLDWDPDHDALRALKVKPGEASVCHFLPTGHITFISTAAATTTNIATE